MNNIILTLISILLSAILASVSFFFDVTTLVESVQVALLSAIMMELFILIWKSNGLEIRNNSSLLGLQTYLDKIDLSKDTSSMFVAMEEDFLKVQLNRHGPRDLFVAHLNSEIESLRAKLSDASQRSELRIKSDYIINVDGVFDSLDIADDRSVKLTFPVRNGEFWAGGPSDQRFLEVLLERVRLKKISQLDILFLTHDLDADEALAVERVCAWLNSKARVKSKIGLQENFKQICSINTIDTNYIDIGIYGSNMLFRAGDAGVEHEGIYSKDPQVVSRYLSVFQECWGSESLCRPPKQGAELPIQASFTEICKITAKSPVKSLQAPKKEA